MMYILTDFLVLVTSLQAPFCFMLELAPSFKFESVSICDFACYCTFQIRKLAKNIDSLFLYKQKGIKI